MLNLQHGAQLIELMLTAGLFVAVEQAVGEFLTIVRQYFLDANRAGQGEVFQEGAGTPGALVFLHFQIYPAGRTSMATNR
jgi:hypothetical protein